MLRSKLFGQLLHICRELSEQPQQELAHKLNVDRTLISKIENGKASVGIELLANWIDATYEGWKSVLTDKQMLDHIRNTLGKPRMAI